MFFRKYQPRYTINEIDTYVQDIASITKLRNDAATGRERGEYTQLLHVMREVLLFMVDALDPEQRVQFQPKLEEAAKQ